MNDQPVEFEVNGLVLRGNFYKAEQPKNLAVLFLHGWTGLPNEPAAQMLAKNGFTSMTFSLSGHNNSDGIIEDQTRQKSLQEVLVAYDFFKTKLPADIKIGAAGTSYGGYMTANLSAERDMECLSMRVPADYWDDDFDKVQINQGGENPEVAHWRLQKLEPSATKALRALHNFDGPVQIIEAELDEMVPHQTVQNYINAVKDKSKLDYRFMKGWPHSLGEDADRNHQYQQILLNWLKTQV
jgi:esterase/lipase